MAHTSKQFKLRILHELDGIAEKYYHVEDLDMYYADYRRRIELLAEITARLKPPAKVLDAGCMPGFTSLALKLLGYDVFVWTGIPYLTKTFLMSMGVKL